MRLALTIIGLLCLSSPLLGRAQQAPQQAAEPEGQRAAEYMTKAHEAEKRLDFNDAVSWYEKAAELGDARSMCELGWIYFGTHDIPGRRFRDFSKAVIWFQKSADLNYTPALTQLAIMYNSDGSLGLPENPDKASQLFLRAAQAGDARAMNHLGVMLSRGRGVRRDIDKAVFWRKKAVEVDKNGESGKAAQSWLYLRDGKPLFSK